jgi:Tol biopolymer transport system component
LVISIAVSPGAGATVARAAFPGTNGEIAFTAQNDYFCSDTNHGLASAIYTFTPGASVTPINVHDPFLRHAGDPEWSPSGKRIAGARYEPIYGHSSQGYDDRGVFIVNRDGSGRTPITTAGYHPAWSPNRKRLAFLDGSGRLRTVKLDRTGSRLLDSHQSQDVDWSSHNRLAYTRYRLGPGGSFKIFTIKPDGTQRRFLIRGEEPDWSPNGRQLVFREETGGLAVINPNGTGFHEIRSSGAPQGFHPVWSPDATQIAFTISTGDVFGDVYVMNANGTGERKVAQLTANSCGNVGEVTTLDWQPARRRWVSTSGR